MLSVCYHCKTVNKLFIIKEELRLTEEQTETLMLEAGFSSYVLTDYMHVWNEKQIGTKNKSSFSIF